MSHLFTRRNVPRVLEERGRLLLGSQRRQQLLFVPVCACGWRGIQTLSDTSARSEAIRHTCKETHT